MTSYLRNFVETKGNEFLKKNGLSKMDIIRSHQEFLVKCKSEYLGGSDAVIRRNDMLENHHPLFYPIKPIDEREMLSRLASLQAPFVEYAI